MHDMQAHLSISSFGSICRFCSWQCGCLLRSPSSERALALGPMKFVLDVAKVATGAGLVVVKSARRVQPRLFSVPVSLRTNLGSSEAEYQESRHKKAAMDNQTQSQRSGNAVAQQQQQQPEELFAPKKAEASKEARPFVSLEADARVQPVSQQVPLPSVDAHLPPP